MASLPLPALPRWVPPVALVAWVGLLAIAAWLRTLGSVWADVTANVVSSAAGGNNFHMAELSSSANGSGLLAGPMTGSGGRSRTRGNAWACFASRMPPFGSGYPSVCYPLRVPGLRGMSARLSKGEAHENMARVLRCSGRYASCTSR